MFNYVYLSKKIFANTYEPVKSLISQLNVSEPSGYSSSKGFQGTEIKWSLPNLNGESQDLYS